MSLHRILVTDFGRGHLEVCQQWEGRSRWGEGQFGTHRADWRGSYRKQAMCDSPQRQTSMLLGKHYRYVGGYVMLHQHVFLLKCGFTAPCTACSHHRALTSSIMANAYLITA